MLAAQKGNLKIVVEVKSFMAESLANEFHTALGQYLDYELGLEEVEPDRIIYLAIPEKIFQRISKIPIILKALDRFQVKTIIFDPNLAEITQWIQK